ncbi:DUF6375 family protein [Paenibacillus dendritiformis]|uniref:DUF6375 family protein n=1 Tax=Paenibacillus dendritiformis TaxID=130049 RepID=UPI00248BF546|nr:DUF6375 family protein [Paenibacillus dendritiformis]WGU96466.1 DUF6375 family protein [Paenibacillus dendritiformis]
MKIWTGYGSEHSMNLVMIGQFKEATDAEEATKLIDQIIQQIRIDEERNQDNKSSQDQFSDGMLELLRTSQLYSLSPSELEQFLYDVRVEIEDNKITLTTDEIDVMAFLKVLLDKGARIEVYSAHDHPNTGYGR